MGLTWHYWSTALSSGFSVVWLKIHVSDAWGNVRDLNDYLLNSKKLARTTYTTSSSFAQAVKNGTVQKGAVIIGYGALWHAAMIGRIDKPNGKAYYYGHDENRNAAWDSCEVSNFFDSPEHDGIYVYNIS